MCPSFLDARLTCSKVCLFFHQKRYFRSFQLTGAPEPIGGQRKGKLSQGFIMFPENALKHLPTFSRVALTICLHAARNGLGGCFPRSTCFPAKLLQFCQSGICSNACKGGPAEVRLWAPSLQSSALPFPSLSPNILVLVCF